MFYLIRTFSFLDYIKFDHFSVFDIKSLKFIHLTRDCFNLFCIKVNIKKLIIVTKMLHQQHLNMFDRNNIKNKHILSSFRD